MDFIIKKCKVMRISKKAQPVETDLCMNESPLEVISEFKDLGLLGDSNLSWNIHEHSIVFKANKMLGLISRTCRGFADVKTLKTLHCSFFFLSQLEHGSVVWSPYTQQNWYDRTYAEKSHQAHSQVRYRLCLPSKEAQPSNSWAKTFHGRCHISIQGPKRLFECGPV